MNEIISINELANQIKKLCNSKSPIIHIPYENAYGIGYEDTPDRIPDNSKAKNKLNFSPAVTINEGLEKTIEWYRMELKKECNKS
jgi:UDP-glucose 4-epimerase